MTVSSRLAALRATIQAEQAKKAAGSGPASPMYAFWLTPENGTSLVRLLPDADESNAMVHREKFQIAMPFNGVVGGSSDPVTIKVISPKTHGLSCPVTQYLKDEGLWDHEATKPIAKQYYPKPTYVYSGLVVKSGFTEEKVPENPIRVFYFNRSLHDAIMAGLQDPEIEDLPTDYEHGRDFKITKTRKGPYANYSTSSFSMKERALSSDERSAIEKFGLVDLSKLLGKAPDAEELDVIMAMFHDSLEGRPFDVAAYGKYYGSWLKPKGKDDNTPLPSDASPVGVDHEAVVDVIRNRSMAG